MKAAIFICSLLISLSVVIAQDSGEDQKPNVEKEPELDQSDAPPSPPSPPIALPPYPYQLMQQYSQYLQYLQYMQYASQYQLASQYPYQYPAVPSQYPSGRYQYPPRPSQYPPIASPYVYPPQYQPQSV